jgi:hypothetical protein
MQENNVHVGKPSVIVRAWGDEPVRLFLHRIENNRSYVGIETAETPIGLPNEQVFAFNEETFKKLSTAFKNRDSRKLGECWAKMTVDDFACNKYKISLECSHDQEHIARAEGASDRNAR